MSKPRVGISECLLGAAVRHDGGHKRDRFVTDVLGDYFEWVSVCPEVEVGMGTPREPIRLTRAADGSALIGVKSGEDWTERMRGYAARRTDELDHEQLRGFILKRASPSCGMERVKVYDHNDVPSPTGRGLFAERLMTRFPNLPVEEEGRLNDRPLRENFVGRVYAYERWRRLRDSAPTPGKVVDFHGRHKLLLLAHDPETYYRMGRLVAEAGTAQLSDLLDRYENDFMHALRKPATPGRQVNTLHHVMGFMKEILSGAEKADVLAVIEDYRRGVVPLVTPLVLLKHHLRRVDNAWIRDQAYLDPYPAELGLRSHV